MSFQKKRSKDTTLSKGARGCNKPSTESRAEKLARKAAQRETFHAAAQDHDRITSILAGEHYTQDRRLGGIGGAPVRIVRGRKVESHKYLPHQSDREMARHLRRAGAVS